ncbi:MAG: hypothetical protein KAS17_01230 [Victivallaceae bacterium]|nr:hypothetical protein [Victivallaceae bacterium]
MKIKLHFFLAGLAIMLLSGCSTSQSDKLPAGDIDIYVKYQNEIATLHNPALRTDSELKYDAALTLYKNVDFSFVREVATLGKIFGARDAHIGQKKFEKQTIIYVYRYKGKRVRFVFIRYNDAIIHAECTDEIK